MKKRLVLLVLSISTVFFTVGMVAPSSSLAATNNAPQSQNQKSTKAKKEKITTKKITQTESIKFVTVTHNDSTLAQGTTKVIQKGIAGSKKVNYKITYSNGKQTKKEVIAQKITKNVVNQIVNVGTYVAPVVVTPAPAPTPEPTSDLSTPAETPAVGPTAQCVDGSYSYSAHRSGTCSHHGGVATWF